MVVRPLYRVPALGLPLYLQAGPQDLLPGIYRGLIRGLAASGGEDPGREVVGRGS